MITFFAALTIHVALSQTTGQNNSGDVLFYHNHEQKSATIESVIPDALEAISEKAAMEVFPTPTTVEDRRAHSDAMRNARMQAANLVEYDILSGPRSRPGAPGFVIINARVRRAEMLELYKGCVRAIPNAPRYKVLLLIDERIETIGGRTTVVEGGKCTATISSNLSEAGWAVINGRQFEKLRSIKTDFARMNGEDMRVVQQIAAEQGADIIVYGNVLARGPRQTNLHGRSYFFWTVDGTMHAVWRDTAVELFSIPLPDGDRKGADDNAPLAGAARALEKAGVSYAHEFLRKMQALPPRTEIQIDVRDCRGTSQINTVCKWLRNLPQVRDANPSLVQQSVARILVQTAPNPDVFELAAKLEESSLDADGTFSLEVTEFGPNSILAHARPN